jgi:threonine aldolase
LATFPQIAIDRATVQTNIVRFTLNARPTTAGFVRALAERGLLVSDIGQGVLRAVTHYGIEAGDIEEALEIVRAVLASG